MLADTAARVEVVSEVDLERGQAQKPRQANGPSKPVSVTGGPERSENGRASGSSTRKSAKGSRDSAEAPVTANGTAGVTSGAGTGAGAEPNDRVNSKVAIPSNITHGIPRKNLTAWDYIKVSFCFIASTVLSSLILTSLLVYSGFRSFRMCFDRKGHDPGIEPTLSPEEKTLRLDLRYYMQLIQLDLEEHIVTTGDGFRLVLHRLIDPKEDTEKRAKRYPILLQHGLMQASATYLTSGNTSIGLFLHRCGYDVWLGNNRSGFFPSHERYSRWNPKMWEWGVLELGVQDIPAFVDFILSSTNNSKLAIAAHSQGTTQVFTGLSRGATPELGDKISSFSALAPAIYPGETLNRWQYRAVRAMPRPLYHLIFGHHAFLGQMASGRYLLPKWLFRRVAYVTFNYMFGWDDALWNPHYNGRQFIFSPSYVSSELMYWWMGPGGMAATGCAFDESADHWFEENFPPLAVFVPGRDTLVDPHSLVTRLQTYETNLKKIEVFDEPNYSHLDVLWATDAIDKIGKPLAKFIWQNVPDEDKANYGPITIDQ